ncbi:hypothetical protein L4D77_16240 [Photobacterium frigidiphilum]|uniref:hypothetical protein n=1 Tax=Photobacterium frigidiphilum TaxID=264736 RepID=UPI003D1077CF
MIYKKLLPGCIISALLLTSTSSTLATEISQNKGHPLTEVSINISDDSESMTAYVTPDMQSDTYGDPIILGSDIQESTVADNPSIIVQTGWELVVTTITNTKINIQARVMKISPLDKTSVQTHIKTLAFDNTSPHTSCQQVQFNGEEIQSIQVCLRSPS